ncbi:unnamed protein product, partial [Polarella glacialis]
KGSSAAKPAAVAAQASMKNVGTPEMHSKGAELIKMLEEQVQKLSEMADENLEQGFLGQHAESVAMRDSAMATLKSLKGQLGIAESPELSGTEASPQPTASAPDPGPAPCESPGAKDLESGALEWSGCAASSQVSSATARPEFRWRELADGRPGSVLE